eukprot:scaffold3502_cov111-Cylindrotheca_fusiformis.AAC.1
MSFLLRNNRRNNGNNNNNIGAVPGFSDGRIIPQPRSTSLVRKKNPSYHPVQHQPMYGSQSGSQILVERNVQKHHQLQEQKSRSRRTTAQAPGAQIQRQEATGVISMSEGTSTTVSILHTPHCIGTNRRCLSWFHCCVVPVLEDLRVLEQQQRESQRKLANARVTKENRFQQHTTLETQLEQQKYKNGELRAQLRQFREFLSCGTRELGARRLAGGRAGDDIQAFEQRLKKGIQAQRMNIMLVRKIDSHIIRLENKGAILARLNAESKEKVSLLQKETLAAKRLEEELRAATHTEVSKAHKFAEEVAVFRIESAKLEEHLLSAKSSEEATRLRVHGIVAQLESETKGHKQMMAKLEEQLCSYERDRQHMVSEENTLTVSFEAKTRNLYETKRRIVSTQQEEGQAPSSCSSDFQEPVPSLDKMMLAAQQEAIGAKLGDQQGKNAQLKEMIERLRENTKNARVKTAQNREHVSALIDSSRRQEIVESERLQRLADFQKQLDRERGETDRLNKSSLDLQKEREIDISNHEQLVAEADRSIAENEALITSLQKQLESESASARDRDDAWRIERAELDSRLKESKHQVKSAQESLSNVENKADDLNRECLRVMQKNVEEVELERAAKIEKVKGQICRMLERHPRLKEIDFVCDNSKTTDQQAEDVLEGLVSELEAEVVASRQVRDDRMKKQAKARRKAEEASAEIRRKEEARQKNRERRQAELKRQEAEQQMQLEAESWKRRQATDEKQSTTLHPVIQSALHLDNEGTETKSQAKRRGIEAKRQVYKKRRGADFYNPLTNGNLSDLESPPEPKLLFEAFESSNDLLASAQMTGNTQSSDKRVRWEDEGDDDDTVEDPTSASNQVVLKAEITKVGSRRRRQYGRSSKGLASISRSSYWPAKKTVARLSRKQNRDSGSTVNSLEQSGDTRDVPANGSKMLPLSKKTSGHRKERQEGRGSTIFTGKSIEKVKTGTVETSNLSSSNERAARLSASTDTGQRTELSSHRRSKNLGTAREQNHFDSLMNIPLVNEEGHSVKSKKSHEKAEKAQDGGLSKGKKSDRCGESNRYDREAHERKEDYALDSKNYQSHKPTIDGRRFHSPANEVEGERERIRGRSLSEGRA